MKIVSKGMAFVWYFLVAEICAARIVEALDGENIHFCVISVLCLLLPVIGYAAKKHCQKLGQEKKLGAIRKFLPTGTAIILYFLAAETYLTNLITGSLMIGSRYENLREPLMAVRGVLSSLIGIDSKHGIFVDRFGRVPNPSASDDVCNLSTACYLIIPSLIMLIAPVVIGICMMLKRLLAKKRKSVG